MNTVSRQVAVARAVCVVGGWGLILCGATAMWGWPASVMVLGFFLALPARYTAPDKVIIKD